MHVQTLNFSTVDSLFARLSTALLPHLIRYPRITKLALEVLHPHVLIAEIAFLVAPVPKTIDMKLMVLS